MSYTLTIDGTSYPLPAQSERNWSAQVNTFFTAVSTKLLQRSGGSFPLSADVDFGTAAGILLSYLKSKTSTNLPSAGFLRLDKADRVIFRNILNSADIPWGLSQTTGRIQSGVPATFSAVAATDVFTSGGKVPVANETVQIQSYTGTGLAFGTNYFVTSVVGSTFKLYTTLGGPTFADVTADGTGVFIVQDEVITSGSVDTLINKSMTAPTITGTVPGGATYTGPTFTSPLVSAGGIHSAQIATPANASVSYNKLYSKSDGFWYTLDSSGVETLVGSSATGSGEINVITNPSAASSGSTGWTAATNYTRTRDTTNSPLSPAISTCFAMSTTTASAESSTSGLYTTGTMPVALRSMKLKVSLWVTVPATSLGVWRLSIYNGSGTRYSLSTDSSSLTTLPAGFSGMFYTTIDTDTSSTYTVSITQTTLTSANTLYMTNAIFGPGIVAQGAAISAQQTFTPVIAGLTATATMKWERVGSRMRGSVFVDCTAAAASLLSISLPTGMTIDSTALEGGDLKNVVGFMNVSSTAGLDGLFISGAAHVITAHSTDYTKLYAASNNGSDASGNVLYAIRNGNAICNATTQFTLNFNIPIVEFAGGAVNLGAGAQISYASNNGSNTAVDDSTNFVAGASQFINYTATHYKDVQLPYPIQATQRPVIELTGDGGTTWLEVGHSNSILTPYVVLNGVTYGMEVRALSSTKVRVYFGQYRTNFSTTFAGAGNVWSDIAATSTYQWRVNVANPSSPVGYGLAGTDGSSGLYKAGQAPGLATGAAIAAGYVGEVVESATAIVAAPTSNVAYNVQSMSVPIGRWKIEGVFFFSAGSVTGNTYVVAALSTSSGIVPGAPSYAHINTASGLQNAGAPVYSLDLNLSAPQTIYLVAQYNFTAVGSSNIAGVIKRTRIA